MNAFPSFLPVGGGFGGARRGLGVGAVIMLVMCVGMAALVALAGEKLIAMFGLTAETAAMGGEFFRTLALFYPVYGLAMALRGFLEGAGEGAEEADARLAGLQ